MDTIIQILASSKPLLLFAIIGTGYLAGHVRVRGIGLGVAAVLFVGLILGAIAPGRLSLPSEIGDTGLILFVYMIGLQSGPGFFAALARRGLALNLLAGLAVFSGILTIVIASLALGLSGPLAAGLFAGAMTNTPALAAALEAVERLVHSGALPEGSAALPVVGYSIAYPFSVIGSILTLHFISKVRRIDFEQEVRQIRGEEGTAASELHSKNFLVTNPRIQKKAITAAALSEQTGAVFSRYRHGHEVHAVLPETILRKGDVAVVVGTARQLGAIELILGEESREHLEHHRDQVDFRRVFVSNPAISGKQIRELPLGHLYGATITRLRRGDVEFAPGPDTCLEVGDRVRVVAPIKRMEEVSKFLGDSMKRVSEAEILSPAFGMILGVLLGMIPIPLPGGSYMKLGFAGGPLIVALILGKLEKTGSIHWNIPQPVNLSLRQFGLLLFLATIGLRAGEPFLSQSSLAGLKLAAVGALVTLIPIGVVVLLSRRLHQMQMVRISGLVAGVGTQPAVLAASQEMTGSDLPSVSYATVYPLVMILKIIAVQFLCMLL